ncbi:MAG: hypothetical protein E6G97_07370 [Alphaproteobacteria bacterium]|nr:MAG: hypothetical protein E6G97_07370 [Alphaproteobacteria bacterium]
MTLEPVAASDTSATVVDYRAGQDRNEARALSHTYAMMSDGELWPMCGYGWNRSGGERFSIFRSAPGTRGDCKLCARNVAAGKPPVTDGFAHKTKWL